MLVRADDDNDEGVFEFFVLLLLPIDFAVSLHTVAINAMSIKVSPFKTTLIFIPRE